MGFRNLRKSHSIRILLLAITGFLILPWSGVGGCLFSQSGEETLDGGGSSGLVISGSFQVPSAVAASRSVLGSLKSAALMASQILGVHKNAVVDEVGVSGTCGAYSDAGVLIGTGTAESSGDFSLTLDADLVPETTESLSLVIYCTMDSSDSTAPAQALMVSGETSEITETTQSVNSESSTVVGMLLGRAFGAGVSFTNNAANIDAALKSLRAALEGTVSGNNVTSGIILLYRAFAAIPGNTQELTSLVGGTVSDAALTTLKASDPTTFNAYTTTTLGALVVLPTEYAAAIDTYVKGTTFTGLSEDQKTFILNQLPYYSVEGVQSVLSQESFQTILGDFANSMISAGETLSPATLGRLVGQVINPYAIFFSGSPQILVGMTYFIPQLADSTYEFSAEDYKKISFMLLSDALKNVTDETKANNFIAWINGVIDIFDDDASDGFVSETESYISDASVYDTDWISQDSGVVFGTTILSATTSHGPSCSLGESGLNLCQIQFSAQSCGCDSKCTTRGDCCSDYQSVCGEYVDTFITLIDSLGSDEGEDDHEDDSDGEGNITCIPENASGCENLLKGSTCENDMDGPFNYATLSENNVTDSQMACLVNYAGSSVTNGCLVITEEDSFPACGIGEDEGGGGGGGMGGGGGGMGGGGGGMGGSGGGMGGSGPSTYNLNFASTDNAFNLPGGIQISLDSSDGSFTINHGPDPLITGVRTMGGVTSDVCSDLHITGDISGNIVKICGQCSFMALSNQIFGFSADSTPFTCSGP